MKNNDALYTGLIILIIAIVMFAFMPFAVIWALNEIFNLGITYTFWKWLAMFVLLLSVNASITKK